MRSNLKRKRTYYWHVKFVEVNESETYISINCEKQPILREGTAKFKADSFIAGQTSPMKFVILENRFDKIHVRKCYILKTVKLTCLMIPNISVLLRIRR